MILGEFIALWQFIYIYIRSTCDVCVLRPYIYGKNGLKVAISVNLIASVDSGLSTFHTCALFPTCYSPHTHNAPLNVPNTHTVLSKLFTMPEWKTNDLMNLILV